MANKSTFGFQRPEDSPGFLLWQTTVTWQRLIKKELEAFNISHAQFVIMALLLWFEEQGERPTQVHISKLSKLDKMTVSKALRTLSALGYIKREECQEDTRAKQVGLTRSGKEVMSHLIPLVEGVDAAFFQPLDQSLFVSMLLSLVKSAH